MLELFDGVLPASMEVATTTNSDGSKENTLDNAMEGVQQQQLESAKAARPVEVAAGN